MHLGGIFSLFCNPSVGLLAQCGRTLGRRALHAQWVALSVEDPLVQGQRGVGAEEQVEILECFRQPKRLHLIIFSWRDLPYIGDAREAPALYLRRSQSDLAVKVNGGKNSCIGKGAMQRAGSPA